MPLSTSHERQQLKHNMLPAIMWSIFALLGSFKEKLLELLKFLLFFRVPHWKQPPGPLANWLPFLGSLPLFIVGPTYVMLSKIAEKYERIYRLRLGKTTFIVICDHVLLQDTFDKDAVCGRNMPPLMDVMEHRGLIHADGECWKNQRFFVNQVLRDMGLPRSAEFRAFDKKAAEAMGPFLDELKTKNGQQLYIDEVLCFTLTNIFFSMIAGKTFERNDQLLISIINACHESYRATEYISLANFIPFFAGLPMNKKITEDFKTRKERFSTYMNSIIQDHRQNLDRDNPKDFIDAYLVQMEGGKIFFTEPQLHAILGDLFTSSLETTAATIHWILLGLIKNQEYQQNIYTQLCEITKNERAPTLDDRTSLTKLEAAIMEGYRFSSILPYGVPHSTTQDTIIDGYSIPKDSTVIGLFWKIHRDPRLWDNPNFFDPNNHFNDDGVLVRSRNLVPFSVGRRMCISDAVANDEIFLILANLLHRFEVLPSDEAPPPSMDDSLEGVLRVPLPFQVKLVLRQS